MALLAALDAHRLAGREGRVESARRTRAEAQVRAILGDRLAARLAVPQLAAESDAVFAAVADHRLDPYTAADRLLELAARPPGA